MKLTWHGHSAFTVETGRNKILIDPFITGNPSAVESVDQIAQGVTHVLVTHGHGDHVGDAADICAKSGAMLVANYEVARYLGGKGVNEAKINPGGPGGTVDCGGFTTTFVPALHSSALELPDGTNIYLGVACGLVLHFADAPALYHMGDTDMFSDMALIQELHEPSIGIVPIGDRFTMGGAVAALACQRFFKFDTVIPCHFGTFPVLDADASKFVGGMEGSKTRVLTPEIGKVVTL